MFATLGICLSLLLVVAFSRASTGILDSKDVQLSLQKPVQVPNQLLEAQDAVKTIIEDANERVLEHLAAMKLKHMQLVRQQFFNALEKRLFRFDVLKSQPTWQLKGCRGSALNCLLLPKKSYLRRPVYPIPRPITYINDQNFCNHLPVNTYLFHECIRRAQLLYTQATITPVTKAYSAAVHVTEKDPVAQSQQIYQDQTSKKIQHVTLPKSIYNLDTTPSINFGKTQKLNDQKKTIQLENEILGIKDIKDDHTFINPSSTSPQTERNILTTSKVTDLVSQDEFVDARIEPETSTLPADKYESTTNSENVHQHLITPPSDLEITVDQRSDQIVTDSLTTSSFIAEAKEIIETSTNYIPNISSSVTPTSDLTLTSSTANGKVQETEIPTESIGNANELPNEPREEVSMISPPEISSQYAFLNPTTDQKDINDITEATETKISPLSREEVQDFKPIPNELNTHIGNTDSIPIQNIQISTITSSTSLNKWLNEVDSIQETSSADTNNLSESPNSAVEKSVTDTTLYNIEGESTVESRSEQSEVTSHTKTTEEIVPKFLGSTSTSKPEDADDTFKTGETESSSDTIENRENVQHLLEDGVVQTTDFKNKENELDIVQTTPFQDKEEDKLTTNSIVYKKPHLDIQDKLLDRLLYPSQSDNPNYEEIHTNTPPVDSKERIVESSSNFEDKTFVTSPRMTFEESTIDPALNVDDKESRTVDEMIGTTEYSELNNLDFTERLLEVNLPTVNSSSNSSINSSSTNGNITNAYQNATNDVLKFTSEFTNTSLEEPSNRGEELSSTTEETLVSEDFFTLGTKDEMSMREKRSPEDKMSGKMEDSSLKNENSSDVYISPTKYASTILELLPVIKEGYRNNAFSDEDKKVIRSIFGEMKTLMDEDSLKEVEKSASDLLMGDETSRIEDTGEYDYESAESKEEKTERRRKRSKNIQILSTLVAKLPKYLLRQSKDLQSSSSLRLSRKVRSSEPQPASETAAILALLAEDGEGVRLDRADDEDDDEYEYYEDDDVNKDEDEDEDEDSYEDLYEIDENPSFSELIKLAKKHRQRKALK